VQTRLFRTSGFQIAVLYVVLLSATLIALVAFVYWSTAKLIDRQVTDTIEAEIRGLSEQYRAEGLPRLIQVIRERSGPRGNPQSVYILASPVFMPLAGNLASWPQESPDANGWLEVRLKRTDDPGDALHIVRGRAFDLAEGFHLFVGRDTEERGNFQRIIVESLAWALLPVLLLGLLGGALIGRYSLRRVEAVRAAGEDIVNGELSRRVPLTGSGDEFDRLAETINKMLDQIDTLMTGMRTVTDSLAHDLRSPLTRAKSGIEMALRAESDPQTYRQVLEQTNSEIEMILRTFESLNNIAQAEAGMNRLALEPLDLSKLLEDVVEVYQPLAEDAGLRLETEIASDIVINGHRQLLAQAIANLMDNALKYTPREGRVRAFLDRTEHGAVLGVADTGPGIPPDDRERVLHRFVRLDDSRGTPGSGLGLSLIAAVAKLHGAELDLADNGPGLKITLLFPER